MTKTAFVLSLPSNTPAAEVIEAARAQGMELSAKHVYKIRSTNRSKLDTDSGSQRSSASGGFPTASALIKSLPLEMSTAEVTAECQKHGFEINRHLIYVTRGAMRRRLAAGQPIGRGRPGRPPRVPEAVSGASESSFRRLVVELGVARARELVMDVEQRLQLLVAGL
ncbi:hypothetical protein ACFL5O_05935 [Myxococcota bacterium]